jgi:uncharacterized repeat protein (TIGR01451 family)
VGSWAYSRAIVIVLGLFFIGTLGLDQEAFAATITSTQSGDWNAGSTWVGGSVPLSTDDVVIAGPHTVNLNAASGTVSVLSLNVIGTLNVADTTLEITTNVGPGLANEFEVRTSQGRLNLNSGAFVSTTDPDADLEVFNGGRVNVNDGSSLTISDVILVQNDGYVFNDCLGPIVVGSSITSQFGFYEQFGTLNGLSPPLPTNQAPLIVTFLPNSYYLPGECPDETGTIVIVKDTVPDDPADFAFTGDLNTFSLDDDADPTLSNTATFADIAIGQYDVTESLSGTHTLTGLVCDDGNSTVDLNTRTATINLEADETVTCTFTNTPTPPGTGTIVIVKDTVPDDPADFAFTGDLNTFSLDDDADPTLSNTATFADIAIGQYDVTESLSGTHTLTGLVCDDGNSTVDLNTRTATINLEADETVTCTFTNTPTPPGTGTITVIKDAQPEINANFDYTIHRDSLGFTNISFSLCDDSACTDPDETSDTFTVPASQFQYGISENNGPDGYSVTTAVCTSPQVIGDVIQGNNIHITVGAGEDWTCTFTNDFSSIIDCEGNEIIPPFFGGGDFLLGLLVPDMYRAYGGVSEEPCADVSIAKTSSPTSIEEFDDFTYFITVTNNGPDTAFDVSVFDSFPDEIDNIIDFPAFCFDIGGNNLSCDLGNLAPGQVVQFAVEVEHDGGENKFTNTACVSTDSEDPDSSNNCDDAETSIIFVCDPQEEEGGCPSRHEANPYPRPNLGDRKHGAGHDNGFCLDGVHCVDVRNLLTHFPEVAVEQGTLHTFSLIVDCQRGSLTCNHVTLGGAIPGTDYYDMQWMVLLDRNPRTGEWGQTIVNEHGEIGDTVTSVLEDVNQTFLEVDITLVVTVPGSFGTPDGVGVPHENNRHIRVVVWDNQGGVSNYIFNDGIFVQDIYAYPQVETSFEAPLEYDKLCLNQDEKKRYTCAFDKVRDWTIRQAEDKLKQLYDEKGKDMDSYAESEQY